MEDDLHIQIGSKVFFKDVDPSIKEEALQTIFQTFGSLLSCKLITDSNGNSKGYGYVEYETEKSAYEAWQRFHGMNVNERVIYVMPFMTKEDDGNDADVLSRTVFIRNLSAYSFLGTYSVLVCYGTVTRIGLLLDENGFPTNDGLVTFETGEEAAFAMKKRNSSEPDTTKWPCRWATCESRICLC